MAIDNEVTVRRLLILANASLDQWSIFQGREPKSDVFANLFQRLAIDHAFPIRGLELRPARVVCDFEAATIAAWNAVSEFAAMVRPDGNVGIMKTHVPDGGAEEED